VSAGESNRLAGVSVALRGGLIGGLLVVLSQLHINFMGYSASLMFLPLAIIYFWPSGANYSASLWMAAGLGLLQDLTGGGPLGLWMLSYAILFIVINPTTRKMGSGMAVHWVFFIVLVGATSALTMALGRISLGQTPNAINMLINGTLISVLFPVIYWVRLFTRQITGADDMAWGR
jgi:rod shape-determining protein MreD